MRDLFLLHEDVVFLNHGSFGACPKPVFARYQAWQTELEQQPVAFLGRRHDALLAEAIAPLADLIHAPASDVVFAINTTAALGTVIRSLRLQDGDEVLASAHEYGALEYAWEHVCAQAGARYVRQSVDDYSSAEAFADAFWQGVTPRTRVIFMSHITSPTALIFPVAEICRRARAAGIFTVIDGAHTVGHLDLDMQAIGADVYASNCHKWLCAPKGSAFLYVRPQHQAWVEPMVLSWGWRAEADFSTRHHQQGTRDLAAFLSVPAAIAFQAEHDWAQARHACHALVVEALQELSDLLGTRPLATPAWYGQMACVPLPAGVDAPALKARLYDEYRVEIPVTQQGGRWYIRASFQAYNTRADLDALLTALRALL